LLVSGTGTFDTKNVGTGKTVTVADVTALSLANGAGGGVVSNYNFTSTGSKSTTADISRREITLSGVTAGNKVYDGTTGATVSTAGGSGWLSGDAVTISATGEFGDKNAGAGKTVTLSSSYGGADAGNYLITDQASATASITPRALTLTPQSISKTYDGLLGYTSNAADLGFLSSQLWGTDRVTQATLVYVDPNAGVGQKEVRLSNVVLDDGHNGLNYTLQLAGNHSSSITKAPLSITALDDTKTQNGIGYRGGNGVLYTGFVGAETPTVLSGALDYGGSSQGAVVSGEYEIRPQGVGSDNYQIRFISGKLTIDRSVTQYNIPQMDSDRNKSPWASASVKLTANSDAAQSNPSGTVAGNGVRYFLSSNIPVNDSLTSATEVMPSQSLVVMVPKNLLIAPEGAITITMPSNLFTTGTPDTPFRLSDPEGKALPNWMSFDSEKRILTITRAVQPELFPMRLLVAKDGESHFVDLITLNP